MSMDGCRGGGQWLVAGRRRSVFSIQYSAFICQPVGDDACDVPRLVVSLYAGDDNRRPATDS